MFVVKRPFRNFGKVMTVGTVISDPTAIKHFNARFAEGKIIGGTEQTLANTAKYVKEKYGVDIRATEKAEAQKETKAKTTTVKTSTVKSSK